MTRISWINAEGTNEDFDHESHQSTRIKKPHDDTTFAAFQLENEVLSATVRQLCAPEIAEEGDRG